MKRVAKKKTLQWACYALISDIHVVRRNCCVQLGLFAVHYIVGSFRHSGVCDILDKARTFLVQFFLTDSIEEFKMYRHIAYFCVFCKSVGQESLPRRDRED